MDDLLREFLTETAESLDVVDRELVRFEKNPRDKEALDKIFRLVHTVKGTCGFLGLPRLESVAHAAETVLGKFRDQTLNVTPGAVSLILESIDRIKQILVDLEKNEIEPQGSDADLIDRLDEIALGKADASGAVAEVAAPVVDPVAATERALGRKLKPGEVSLEDLDAAFAAAPGPDPSAPASKPVDPQAEETSAAVQKKPTETAIANQSIRVNVDVLENLMTLVSELVLTRNQLLQMVRNQESSEFKGPLQRLSNVTSDLQDSVMKTRMQPIGSAWQKLPRIVRDLAQELGKKIQLDMTGADTELDRQVLELIKDPLTHMVRNSADHGLETTMERKALGKPEMGTIKLKAFHEGGHIIIEVGDDGRGLSTAKIREKALRQGLASEAELERMSEAQIQKFIFNAGFSTAAKVTNVSGRGVGLDVVRTNVELIGGTIDLNSAEGKGTTFTIKIPLTLAIISALIVETAGERYALPQISVIELVRTKPGTDHRIEFISKTPVLRLRDRLLPLVDLAHVLKLKGVPANDEAPRAEAFVVVTQVGSQVFGIIVDGVFDTEEIVVKPLANLLRGIPVFSGNTILGDGSVIMIIDPNGIAATVSEESRQIRSDSESAARRQNEGEEKTSMLIFRAGTEDPKAVPLSLVTRLEEMDVSRIEVSDGQTLVQYRGRLMPVAHAAPGAPMKTAGRQAFLVFSDGNRSIGLAVDEIIDITEERLNIEIASTRPGVLGSATLKGRATEILDVSRHITAIYPDWFDRIDRDRSDEKKKRVLLVDDSSFFLNLLTPILVAAGYDVTAALGADEALRLRDGGATFDVILSDIEMPGTDGFALATHIRKDESWRDVPLLALTSRVQPEDVVRGREAGFDHHIAKSDRERLLETLKVVACTKGVAA